MTSICMCGYSIEHGEGRVADDSLPVDRVHVDRATCLRAGIREDANLIGVTDAVPETIEASLQLSEAALVGLGVATGPVIASIHDKRDEFRRELQQAAGVAGRERTPFRARKKQPVVPRVGNS